LSGLFIDPEDGGDRNYISPKRRLDFNVLQDVISQKIALFITAAERTSNPTSYKFSVVDRTLSPCAEVSTEESRVLGGGNSYDQA
jgi:hypothetical protein